MKKITQDDIENDYKEAVREKFRNEKIEGKYLHYLNNPSQALLRDLCWEIFSSNPKADDLNTYRNFFKSEFNPKEEDTSIPYTNKFKKVGAFLRGGIKPANIITIDMAAILVDFKDRPYYKFKKNYNEGRDEEDENEKEKNNVEPEMGNKENTEHITEEKSKNSPPENSPINLFINNTEKSSGKSNKQKWKFTIIGILILSCLGLLINVIFLQKQCMQWSGDHYEKVDCNFKGNGLIPSTIEAFDEIKFELKKVNVCDTTNCFINGKSIIWYAKTDNGADFFNTHGMHPENGKALRPVTKYIFGRYKKKDCASK